MENLNEYLDGQINALSDYDLFVFDTFMDEEFHRTGSEAIAPENPLRRVNHLKNIAVNLWNCENLGEIETAGIKFNLDADRDNNPQLLEDYAYGENEISALDVAIAILKDDPRGVNVVPMLESAITAIRTHVLPETHPMAVN